MAKAKKTRKKKPAPQCSILAFDQSTTSVGWALLCGWRNKHPLIQYGVIQPDGDLNERLDAMWHPIHGIITKSRYINPVHLVLEGYSYGSRNNRETMGEAVGIIKAAAFDVGVMPSEVEAIAIPDWKKAIYPTWPGWTKKNWEAAKRKGAFQHSQPDKIAIRHKLIELFGLNVQEEDAADAVGIAVAFNDKRYDREWMTDHGKAFIKEE